jgi:anhydro-N-acetylmuramic acid kinase
MLVIGLMSGTSMDAIDAALLQIERDGDTLELLLKTFIMVPFQRQLRERIDLLLPPHSGSTSDVCEMQVLLGEAFANAARQVAADSHIPLAQIDVIASHGQTVYHQVAPGKTRSTLQLAAPAVIAERTGCTVAADFRPRDIAAGGQGAPLVPYLDLLLFGGDQVRRAVQNIGGIGNVTYIDRSGTALAFDTGPGNVLIDEAVRLLTNGAMGYDHNGRMAAAGTIHEELLDQWMAHPFFAVPPPRSTGRELFGVAEAQRMVAEAREFGVGATSIITTLTALTAWSIANAYRQYCGGIDEIVLSGGGTRNPTLTRMIAAAMPEARIRVLDEIGLDADAKEAVAFGVLGYASLHGYPNSLPGATGATHATVLGSLTPGKNYRQLLQMVSASPTEPPQRLIIRREDP